MYDYHESILKLHPVSDHVQWPAHIKWSRHRSEIQRTDVTSLWCQRVSSASLREQGCTSGMICGVQTSFFGEKIAAMVKLQTTEKVADAMQTFFSESSSASGCEEDLNDFTQSMDLICSPTNIEDLNGRKDCLQDVLDLVGGLIEDKASELGVALSLTSRGLAVISNARLHLECCGRSIELEQEINASCLHIKGVMNTVVDFSRASHDDIMSVHNVVNTMKDRLDKAQQDFLLSASSRTSRMILVCHHPTPF